VFDGGGFIMVPTGSQRTHSITPEGVEALYRSPGPLLAAGGLWAAHRQPHVIATPMKGIPTLRRKCGKTTNFRVTTLYHQTA
jgi:hypothetical protein